MPRPYFTTSIIPPRQVSCSAFTVAMILLAAPALALTGTVTAVHDGDTFTIDGHTKIRVFGIDAPELLQKCRADAIHAPGSSPCVPCGENSRQALEGLVLGKEVRCENRGQSYDRLVGDRVVGKLHVGPWMLTQPSPAAGDVHRPDGQHRRRPKILPPRPVERLALGYNPHVAARMERKGNCPPRESVGQCRLTDLAGVAKTSDLIQANTFARRGR